MADEPPTLSRRSDETVRDAKEDAETAATREELKQTAISERNTQVTDASFRSEEEVWTPPEDTNEDEDATQPAAPANAEIAPRVSTPEPKPASPSEAELREQIASPGKKKRQHAELDEAKSPTDVKSPASLTSPAKSVNGTAAKKQDRSEPQKKRARDENSPPPEIHRRSSEEEQANKIDSQIAAKPAISEIEPSKATEAKPTTSASAFASSGFSKLASSTQSPFANFGAKGSVFGGQSSKPGGFGSFGGAVAPSSGSTTTATAPAPAAPKLTFDKAAGSASPFAAANGKKEGEAAPSAFGGSVFGGALGKTGFGSASTGSAGFGGSIFGAGKATGFGKPAEAFKSAKPAKEFGAPESDAEDDDEGDGSADESGASVKSPKDGQAEDDNEIRPVEDEKKVKLRKVTVDDGEAGEFSLLVVRGRMFYLDKSTNEDGTIVSAWKERGAGMLKINVPNETLDIDEESGQMDPDSFDLEVLRTGKLDSSKVVRLLMRQDSTHRVILNSAILRQTKYDLKETLKSSSVLFTAIEGAEGKAVQVQIRMNNANAKELVALVSYIQRELSKDVQG